MEFSLAGLVWAAFLGMVAGNYATNPIYRLPRNEPLFGKKPYCGDCNAELKPKDLFPIFSWLSTRGKCRYCSAKVPAEYFVTEVWVTIIFVTAYMHEGFSEIFLLTTFGYTALVMLAMMEIIDRYFSWSVAGISAAIALMVSLVYHQSLFPALTVGFYSALAATAVWKLSPAKNASPPSYVVIAGLAGLWLGGSTVNNTLLAYSVNWGLILLVFFGSRLFRPAPLSLAVALVSSVWLVVEALHILPNP